MPPPPVHDPTEVVEAIVSIALDPTKDETIVSSAGKASAATARVSRAAAEAMLSKAHEKQMKTPPAPPSEGGLTRPTPVGTGVTGGWKEKEKEEKQEKKTRRRSPRGGRPEV